jgi:hypothetical protein
MLGVFNEIRGQEEVLALIKRYSLKGLPEWVVVKQEPAPVELRVEEKLDRGPEFRVERGPNTTVLTWNNSGFLRSFLSLKRSPEPTTMEDGFRTSSKKKARKPNNTPASPPINVRPQEDVKKGKLRKLEAILEEENADDEDEWEPAEEDEEENQRMCMVQTTQKNMKKLIKKSKGKKNQRKDPESREPPTNQDAGGGVNPTPNDAKGVKGKKPTKMSPIGDTVKKDLKGNTAERDKTLPQISSPPHSPKPNHPSPPPPKPPNGDSAPKGKKKKKTSPTGTKNKISAQADSNQEPLNRDGGSSEHNTK